MYLHPREYHTRPNLTLIRVITGETQKFCRIIRNGNNSSMVDIIRYHLVERIGQVRNIPPKSVIKLENSSMFLFLMTWSSILKFCVSYILANKSQGVEFMACGKYTSSKNIIVCWFLKVDFYGMFGEVFKFISVLGASPDFS